MYLMEWIHEENLCFLFFREEKSFGKWKNLTEVIYIVNVANRFVRFFRDFFLLSQTFYR